MTTAIRLDPELHADIERASRKNKRSLTAEIESRLKDSLADRFGESPDRDLALAIVELAKLLKSQTGCSWLNDRYTFDAFCAGIQVILRTLAPPGEPELPQRVQELAKIPGFEEFARSAELVGVGIANGFLTMIAGSDQLPAPYNGGAKMQTLRKRLALESGGERYQKLAWRMSVRKGDS